ncbi:FtsX-like permease family protein [Anaerocolumna sedimenticola]|uniref:FtsX-like permease family protein n=1 Tax=Anaerocolumna sedimenticola TaxID=2696063 RepID=UPI0038BB4F42
MLFQKAGHNDFCSGRNWLCCIHHLYIRIFFRSKARDTGMLLALGASRRQLKRLLYQDLTLISFVSCGTGALLGTPLAWGCGISFGFSLWIPRR